MIQRILLYILVFSSSCIAARAQVKKPALTPIDSSVRAADTTARKNVAEKKKPVPALPDSIYEVPGGIRIGIDISRFILKVFQPYRTDVSFAGDMRIKKDLYLAAELGFHSTSHSDSNYTYKGNGIFTTVGVDWNFLQKISNKERYMIYGGIRYGFAHLNYEAPSYTIYDSYWGDKLPGSFPKTSVNAHWVELILGLKAEVLKNFFLGWSIREKIKVSGPSKDLAFPPIVIPGFGSGTKGSQFDWQYTVSYCIPLGNIKVHVPRKAEPPKRR
ncbi:hypothetical protein SAMN04488505_101363 [Chitinophaga rupis]|uniref:Outer membrane protein beta-barrel domain-containing protein n=1 Tax=Chitinophaga rupis TaxID=573321 RepID=A0A1H7HTT0_9BACT|nr:DUF6048 family protein [Chitinophaga rupis]SEK52490.1 hypothetical protein SAMN04488505_101363 [Chitinophaga rupis]